MAFRLALISDELLPMLPPEFWVEKDYVLDVIKVSNGKVGFVITSKAICDDTWREDAKREMAAILAMPTPEPEMRSNQT